MERRGRGQFLAGQPRQVVTHHDALGQRLMHRHGQTAAQFGEPHQQQAEAVLRIHLVVGQQTQVLQDLVAQVMGLINDEHRALAGLQGQAADLAADGTEGRGAVALDGQPQLPANGFVHVQHIAGGQGHIEDSIESRMQAGGDLAAHGGLA